MPFIAENERPGGRPPVTELTMEDGTRLRVMNNTAFGRRATGLTKIRNGFNHVLYFPPVGPYVAGAEEAVGSDTNASEDSFTRFMHETAENQSFQYCNNRRYSVEPIFRSHQEYTEAVNFAKECAFGAVIRAKALQAYANELEEHRIWQEANPNAAVRHSRDPGLTLGTLPHPRIDRRDAEELAGVEEPMLRNFETHVQEVVADEMGPRSALRKYIEGLPEAIQMIEPHHRRLSDRDGVARDHIYRCPCSEACASWRQAVGDGTEEMCNARNRGASFEGLLVHLSSTSENISKAIADRHLATLIYMEQMYATNDTCPVRERFVFEE